MENLFITSAYPAVSRSGALNSLPGSTNAVSTQPCDPVHTGIQDSTVGSAKELVMAQEDPHGRHHPESGFWNSCRKARATVDSWPD